MWKCPVLCSAAFLLPALSAAFISPYPGFYQGHPATYGSAFKNNQGLYGSDDYYQNYLNHQKKYKSNYDDTYSEVAIYPEELYKGSVSAHSSHRAEEAGDGARDGAGAVAGAGAGAGAAPAAQKGTLVDRTFGPLGPPFGLPVFPLGAAVGTFLALIMVIILGLNLFIIFYQVDASFLLFPSTVEVSVNRPWAPGAHFSKKDS